MKTKTLFFALLFASSGALAHNCPAEMKAIDAALPKAKLAGDKLEEVRKLHKDGKHSASMEALGKAKKALGI